MSVRNFAPGDSPELLRLTRQLFGSDEGCDLWDEQVFVFDRGDDRLGGYISVSKRPWTEGSDAQPVAHVEGWFVDRDLRRRGVGRMLMNAATQWACVNGMLELCSDAELNNHVSFAAHRRMGFEPTIQLQYFRKPLTQAAKRVVGQG